MLGPFFAVAVRSPARRRTTFVTALVHLLLGTVASTFAQGPTRPLVLGMTLLLAGIVEGAILIGWRLTQLPRSQALEFLLVSPLSPRRVFVSEALVGLARLALVQLSVLPLLVGLATLNLLAWADVFVFILMPFSWGALTGLGLTTWAYESVRVRRVGERLAGALILVYLVVGVLAAERLPSWLAVLPGAWGLRFLDFLRGMHENNPFTLLATWCLFPPRLALRPMVMLELVVLVVIGLFVLRCAWRLRGHFQDRHYTQKTESKRRRRGTIGRRPLSWWAVKRVMEYAGRVNLYLAGGFGVIYAAYIVAGDQWPPWLGRDTFRVIEMGMAGVPGLSTGLVILAAVPAAFQYGLWDSSIPDRCRRLELLLLTELDATDYLYAALAAAWQRGRGYLAVALLLWAASVYAGHLSLGQASAAVAASVILWGGYFAAGYWSFAKGLQANGLGSLLTLGLPLVAWLLHTVAGAETACLVPPGLVYVALTLGAEPLWWTAMLGYSVAGVILLHSTHRHCDRWLRRWFDRNQGKKTAE
ncbi:MAG TPA: hypothetical protein PKC45_10135 [Gemmatales bacterium]|nr:hypothetical protein [Gemmatales bacterium]